MVDKQTVKNGQEWYIKQEVEPEDWRCIEPHKVIEQGQRNERSIDYRNKGQWTYTRPFPFGRKINSRNAIADDNGANKAIKDR